MSTSSRRPDFNSYILRAIEHLNANYGGMGYLITTAFTHNLDYSTPGEIKAAPKPPKTMCVAAVSEVIIVALKMYVDERHDTAVFAKLPARSWMGGRPTDIRPYMFVYDNVESNGTADALAHFGIGEHAPFSTLVPGDFIGLNRATGSGHAVVFLGFLNASGEILSRYDASKVVGFKYFSAQTGGLGYRWAFFEGNCPDLGPGKPRDCRIVRSDNQKFLNTGYMWHPGQWITESAAKTLKANLVEKHSLRLLTKRMGRIPTKIDRERLRPTELRQLEVEVAGELLKELPLKINPKFNGVTVDR
ncbi:MAG TPA: hypothetical protein VN253_01535 [Kofleriaceae bacterium]|nr:hypothetical protein [Kofleriaceae bacterium]